jgi:hypothetical protein
MGAVAQCTRALNVPSCRVVDRRLGHVHVSEQRGVVGEGCQ